MGSGRDVSSICGTHAAKRSKKRQRHSDACKNTKRCVRRTESAEMWREDLARNCRRRRIWTVWRALASSSQGAGGVSVHTARGGGESVGLSA
eukprot:6213996-Pleurochrysis_carterae.AAC.1